MNKQGKIITVVIAIILMAYFFIYKPYFTTKGIINREIKQEKILEDKVLYYACGLPKDHRYYKMFKKECYELERRAIYEDSQRCSPSYMGCSD